MKNKLTVLIEGTGSEFVQGTIKKEHFDAYKYSGLSWQDYCTKNWKLDGYWDVNNISHLTGITIDNAVITIMIDNQKIWAGKYCSILENADDPDASTVFVHEHGIMAIGDNEVSETHVLISSITSEHLQAETTININTKEVSFELPSEDNGNKCFINDLELGFIIESTDGMGYGYDYGDFILGFIFDGVKYEFEYPGGMGIPEIYVEKKPDWLSNQKF